MFFVVGGVSTRVDQLEPPDVGLFAAVLLVALATRVLGVGMTTWFIGENLCNALTLGVLMNARGVTEIVVLTFGLDAGIINSAMFTVLVLVALATTMLTVPFLRLVRQPHSVIEVGVS